MELSMVSQYLRPIPIPLYFVGNTKVIHVILESYFVHKEGSRPHVSELISLHWNMLNLFLVLKEIPWEDALLSFLPSFLPAFTPSFPSY
jgi:hypothetical protein